MAAVMTELKERLSEGCIDFSASSVLADAVIADVADTKRIMMLSRRWTLE